ncbi:MAG: hypothetical protein AB7P07_06120 [Hyphomonadaceae bacterium]
MKLSPLNLIGVLATGAVVAACVENPATGRRQLSLVSEEGGVRSRWCVGLLAAHGA